MGGGLLEPLQGRGCCTSCKCSLVWALFNDWSCEWVPVLVLQIGKTLRVGGWVKTGREAGAGAFAFLEVNDGSCFESIQVGRGCTGQEHVGMRLGHLAQEQLHPAVPQADVRQD